MRKQGATRDSGSNGLTQQEAFAKFKELGERVMLTETQRFKLMMVHKLWELEGVTAVEFFQKWFERGQATFSVWKRKHGYVDEARSEATRAGIEAAKADGEPIETVGSADETEPEDQIDEPEDADDQTPQSGRNGNGKPKKVTPKGVLLINHVAVLVKDAKDGQVKRSYRRVLAKLKDPTAREKHKSDLDAALGFLKTLRQIAAESDATPQKIPA